MKGKGVKGAISLPPLTLFQRDVLDLFAHQKGPLFYLNKGGIDKENSANIEINGPRRL